MTVKSLMLGAISLGAVVAIAGCGASSSPTPTPSSSALTIPGLGTGSGGTAAGANTLLTVADVQTISGDPNVAVVSGSCSATTCVYADTTGAGGGGGVIIVEPIPGLASQAALQAALNVALSNGGVTANGGTVAAVPGLGSAAIKEIDANSATYAFAKDNYVVVINISSSTNSGASMDAQLGVAAQAAGGKV
jgi:hypothetical protein